MRVKRVIDLPRRREPFADLAEVHEFLQTRHKTEDETLRDLADAVNINEGSAIDETTKTTLPTAGIKFRGRFVFVEDFDGAGTGDVLFWCHLDGSSPQVYVWFRIGPP